jgi:hypothetical protein
VVLLKKYVFCLSWYIWGRFRRRLSLGPGLLSMSPHFNRVFFVVEVVVWYFVIIVGDLFCYPYYYYYFFL